MSKINIKLLIRVISLLVLCVLSNTLVKGQIIIKGKVSDGADPLIGATVSILDQNIGTTTDHLGDFALQYSGEMPCVLEISYVGYQTLSVDLASDGKKNVDLKTLVLTAGAMIDKVTVTGRLNRFGEAAAGFKMLQSSSIKAIASAETIERLPDKNAAEALSRMAGVVMESDQGEGRYISFRGTPTDWSSALVNGNRMPVANEESLGRSMDFSVLPTSLIESIENNLNITPDMEGDAIGGSANFITRSIPDSFQIETDLGYGINSKARKPQMNGTLLLSNRIANGKLGYLVGCSLFNRNWSTDNYEIFYGNNDDHSLERLELRKYNGVKTTYGANAKIDYKISDHADVYALGFLGRMNDHEHNRKTMYNWVVGVGQSIRLQNVNSILQNELYGGEIGGKLKVSDKLSSRWRAATYDASFTYGPVAEFNGRKVRGYLAHEFEQVVRFKDFLYLDENGEVTTPEAAFKRTKLLDIDSPVEGYGDNYTNIQPMWDEIVPVKPADTTFSLIKSFAELNEHFERDPLVAQIDFDYQQDEHTRFSFGAKYRTKEGERRIGFEAWQRNPFSDRIILHNELDIQPVPNANSFLQEIDSPYRDRLNLFMTDNQMESFLDENRDDLLFLPFDENTAFYPQFIGSSYQYDEQVWAGYLLMDRRSVDRLSYNIGARVEHTDVFVTADSVFFDIETLGNKTVETSVNRKYTSILPMLNLKYTLASKENLRFAATRTFRRPNFNELKPGAPEIHYSHFHLLRGNKNLRPTYSWNFDLSYQKFTGLTSYFMISTYYKYVTDHIYTAFESASLDGNSAAGQFAIPGGLVAKEYLNSDYAYIFGGEVSIVQKLNFITSALKNFSLGVNYSFTESKMSIASRDELQPLPRQAKHVFNARVTYENKKLNTNLALNYRSPYLLELNLFAINDPVTGKPVAIQQNNDYDNFMGRNLSMDFSISYNINSRISLYAQANNLLNSELVMYRGQRERPVQTEYYGRRGLIGMKYRINQTTRDNSLNHFQHDNHDGHVH